jgi:hypothetical protein
MAKKIYERNKKDQLILKLQERRVIISTVISCTIGLSAYDISILKNQEVIMETLLYILIEPI